MVVAPSSLSHLDERLGRQGRGARRARSSGGGARCVVVEWRALSSTARALARGRGKRATPVLPSRGGQLQARHPLPSHLPVEGSCRRQVDALHDAAAQLLGQQHTSSAGQRLRRHPRLCGHPVAGGVADGGRRGGGLHALGEGREIVWVHGRQGWAVGFGGVCKVHNARRGRRQSAAGRRSRRCEVERSRLHIGRRPRRGDGRVRWGWLNLRCSGQLHRRTHDRLARRAGRLLTAGCILLAAALRERRRFRGGRCQADVQLPVLQAGLPGAASTGVRVNPVQGGACEVPGPRRHAGLDSSHLGVAGAVLRLEHKRRALELRPTPLP